MEHVIDEMIDELRNEIIPTGEAILDEMTETYRYFEETTEDPIERLIRPTRERHEPVRVTYSQVLKEKNRDRTQT